MSQFYFVVCLLVTLITPQLLVLGTPVDDSLHLDSYEVGKTVHIGPLELIVLGRYGGKTYLVSTNANTQNNARLDCGNDLLTITFGMQELSFIQGALTSSGITTAIWTDYTNRVYGDCFVSLPGDFVDHDLPLTSNANQVGLTITRTGGLTPYYTNQALRYICVT